MSRGADFVHLAGTLPKLRPAGAHNAGQPRGPFGTMSPKHLQPCMHPNSGIWCYGPRSCWPDGHFSWPSWPGNADALRAVGSRRLEPQWLVVLVAARENGSNMCRVRAFVPRTSTAQDGWQQSAFAPVGNRGDEVRCSACFRLPSPGSPARVTYVTTSGAIKP